MKRTLLVSLLLLLLAGTLLGNRLTARALDTQLLPFLSDMLGAPIVAQGVDANLLRLEAGTPLLTIGDDTARTVVARDLRVRLSFEALLAGELRLEYGSATELTIDPYLWPVSDEPSGGDFSFLEPWLPGSITVGSFSYRTGPDQALEIADLTSERQPDDAVNFKGLLDAGSVQAQVALASLADVLALRRLDAQGELDSHPEPVSPLSLKVSIAPDPDAAYRLTVGASARGLRASADSWNASAWSLPDHSAVQIDVLDAGEFHLPGAAPLAAAKELELEDLLAEVIPELDLPVHRSDVSARELLVADMARRDTTMRVTTGPDGILLEDIISHGPLSVLRGSLGLRRGADAWEASADLAVAPELQATGLAERPMRLSEGSLTLAASGNTWGELLYSASGGFDLSGEYHGAIVTDFSGRARLDSTVDHFRVHDIDMVLGDNRLFGSFELSGASDERLLGVELEATKLDLDFLGSDIDEEESKPGLLVPSYLAYSPGLEVDLSLRAGELSAAGMRLRQVRAELERRTDGGSTVLEAVGPGGGKVTANLNARSVSDDAAAMTLDVAFLRTDLAAMFGQQALLNSRTSGTLSVTGEGGSVQAMFETMRGEAALALEVRADDDWTRAPRPNESLQVSGAAELVLAGDRVTGLNVEELDIDGLNQDLTGAISVVDGRQPWLAAELTSESLDVDELLKLLPERPADGRTSYLDILRSFTAARLDLQVASLVVAGEPFSEARLLMSSDVDKLALDALAFSFDGTRLDADGNIRWQGDEARLRGSASIQRIDLDRFLIRAGGTPAVPVTMQLEASSHGMTGADLLDNLVLQLAADPSPGQSLASGDARHLRLKVQPYGEQLQVDINALRWHQSELAGRLIYQPGDVPGFDLRVDRGRLDLRPWESLPAAPAAQLDAPELSDIDQLAADSAAAVERLMTLFQRVFGAAGTMGADSDGTLFSSEPLRLEVLEDFTLNLDASLDALEGDYIEARDLRLRGDARAGHLDLSVAIGEIGGGSGSGRLRLEALGQLPRWEFLLDVDNVLGLKPRETYPRTGVLSLRSTGVSPAGIARSAQGLIFLELGRGPFDYGNSTFLTRDLATSAFEALLPNARSQQPQLQCGMLLGIVKDGLASTPYGWAARTRSMNLLGQMEIDLREETLLVKLDSRSREGLGLSVSSIFSNSVQIRGPLTDPRIVPNSTGLAWRGWAAYMTAGLSVLGESFIKRLLASQNPCEGVTERIVEEVCPRNSPDTKLLPVCR